MNAIPVSVVRVKVSRGWIAYVRYENRFLDQDIACDSLWMLDRKIDYLFRSVTRGRR